MSVAAAYSTAINPVGIRPGSATVLIVEDDRKLRERLLGQFAELGIQAMEASAGFSAVKLANTQRPDLIVLDGLLPEMHGFEVARFIRRIDPAYKPHIAMITAIYKNIRYHNEARLKYGIDDYLIKPASDAAIAEIVARVEAQVRA